MPVARDVTGVYKDLWGPPSAKLVACDELGGLLVGIFWVLLASVRVHSVRVGWGAYTTTEHILSCTPRDAEGIC